MIEVHKLGEPERMAFYAPLPAAPRIFPQKDFVGFEINGVTFCLPFEMALGLAKELELAASIGIRLQGDTGL